MASLIDDLSMIVRTKELKELSGKEKTKLRVALRKIIENDEYKFCAETREVYVPIKKIMNNAELNYKYISFSPISEYFESLGFDIVMKYCFLLGELRKVKCLSFNISEKESV